MDNKPIIFTVHARIRLAEREISELEAIEVLQRGSSIGYRDGKKVFEYLTNVVVFEERDDVIQVITVYKSDKSLEQKIEKIPSPNEWWRESSKETFINQAYFLLEKGLTEEEVLKHLEELFQAVCAEYGE